MNDTDGPSKIVASLPMLYSLAGLYHNRTDLSDMKIIANGKSYPVHRVIISMHSCQFANHCRDCLPTLPSPVLELNSPSGNDNVEAMIEFMYTFDYSLPKALIEAEQARRSEAVPDFRVHEFHVVMAWVAEGHHMQVRSLKFMFEGVASTYISFQGLTYVATMKFRQTLSSHAISVQTFIKLAKIAFGLPGTLPTIRNVLLSHAAKNPSLNIAIHPHEPRPLLIVSVQTPSGEHQGLNPIHLSCDADYTTSTRMDVFRCIKCNKDQWRDDIVSMNESYTCKECGFASTGRGWGVDVKKKQQKAKKQDEKLGRLFFCRGCGEGQVRIDIEDSQDVYRCNSCGMEKSGHAWEGCQSREGARESE